MFSKMHWNNLLLCSRDQYDRDKYCLGHVKACGGAKVVWVRAKDHQPSSTQKESSFKAAICEAAKKVINFSNFIRLVCASFYYIDPITFFNGYNNLFIPMHLVRFLAKRLYDIIFYDVCVRAAFFRPKPSLLYPLGHHACRQDMLSNIHLRCMLKQSTLKQASSLSGYVEKVIFPCPLKIIGGINHSR